MFTKTTLENSVTSMISKVLGLPSGKVVLNDDFLQLGGNSTLGAEVASLLKESYPSLRITPLDIIRCRTTGAIIDFLRRQGIG